MSPDLVAALAHHRAGRLDRAAALYQKVLRKDPRQPDALHLLGVLMTSRGKFEHAIQLIGKAVSIIPAFAEAHSNLGNALDGAGHSEKAEASYRIAIRLDARLAAAHCNLARLLNGRGDFSQAVTHFQTALAYDRSLAQAHLGLALALQGLGRVEAEGSFAEALRLNAEDVDTLCAFGAWLLDAGNPERARDHATRALARHADHVAALCLLGSVQRRTGAIASSIETFRRAAAISPGSAVAWSGLGAALRTIGKFDDAADCYRRALALKPDLAEAHRDMALMGRFAGELDQLGSLLADASAPTHHRVAAGFALGKSLDDGNRFDEAFRAYAAANTLFRDAEAKAGRGFNADALRAEVDRLIAKGPGAPVPSGASIAAPMPVFVLGMPRTGTSLVEQVLASHPEVFGAGELTAIGELAADLRQINGETHPGQMEASALANKHLTRLAALSGSRSRVIDKMPDNIFFVDLIVRLFPGSRILLCTRDALDTCLSCYFQRFAGRTQLFSYDLSWCGERYRETARLARHWLKVIAPTMITEVKYETVVTDFEAETRRLLGFLDLPWHPACLNFQNTERPVLTASSWQVRQALFASSVGRSRHYESHLAPLIASLGGEASA